MKYFSNFVRMAAAAVLIFLVYQYSTNFKSPNIEMQKSVLVNSAKDVLLGSNATPYQMKMVRLEETDMQYTLHSAVKKTVDNVQYNAWPMKISGTAIVQLNSNDFFNIRQKYNATFSYVAYYFVDAVGENKYVTEDVKVDSHKIK